MHLVRLLSSVLLATFTRVLAQGAPVGKKTHILNEKNFGETTKSGTWIVKHYSPFCMHCQHFQPTWDTVVADRVEELYDNNVHFAEVNCVENMNLCELNMASAWPTVVVFRDGKRQNSIAGNKSEKALRSFVDEAANAKERKYADASVVLNAENYTMHANEGVWLVKLYSPSCPHCQAMAPEWAQMTKDVADEMAAKGVYFGEVDCLANRKLCEEKKVDGYPTINLFVNGVFVEEMMARYKYEPMKEYAQNLVVRKEAGEFDKPVAAANVKDAADRGWDDDVVDDNEVKAKEHAEAEAQRKAEEQMAAANEQTQYNVDGEVVVLTKANFAELTSTGPWFIKFYAPWCGHCQHLAPVWIQLAEAAKGKVNVGEVNCDEESSLCSKYNVQGYPSIKLLWEGETSDFKGARDLESMMQFVENTMAQPLVVHTADELLAARGSYEVAYVLAYSQTDTSAKTRAILGHVKQNAQKMFLSKQLTLIDDLAVAQKALAPDHASSTWSDGPVLVALKDGKTVRYTGNLNSDDELREWFYAERFPLLPELSRENSDDLFYDTAYLVLTIIDTERGAEHVATQKEIARDAAIEYSKAYGAPGKSSGGAVKNSVRFAWVDGVKWASYVDRVFRLKKAQWPAVIIAQPTEDRYFVEDTKGQAIEVSKMGIYLAVRAAVEGRLKAQSTNSIIVQVVHVVGGAIAAVFALLFGSMIRTLVSVSVLGFVSYALYRRSSGRRGGARGDTYIVKAD